MALARVLIAGCGDVGTELGLALAADGDTVFGLRRNPARLPSPIRGVAGDLGRADGLGAVPSDVDLVVYTAAADGFDDAAYARAYVEGQRNLLAALNRPPRRWLFASSTSVYAQRGGEWVDEDSPTEPRGFSGRRLLEGEASVAAMPCEGVSVRFGGIYGPGRERLVTRVRDGHPCVETPPQWTNRIHRDDCAGVLRHLARLATVQPVYVAVDDEPAPMCAVMDWLADRLGVARPPRGAGDDEPRRGGNRRVRNARLRATGYRMRYPSYREGYAAMLAGGAVR